MSSTRCDGQAFMAMATRVIPRECAQRGNQAMPWEIHPETQSGHMGEKMRGVQGDPKLGWRTDEPVV